MKKRELRPYHGVLFILCFAVLLFVVEPIIIKQIGIYGTAIGELLFLLLAVLYAAIFRADFKKVFPIRKPKGSAIGGTILLWGGTFGVMTVTSVVTMYLFPEQVASASQGMGNITVGLPFLLGVLMIAVAPAICEEAVFRGVFMRCLAPIGNKWVVLVITGTLFGAFHMDWVKFIPTAMLGVLFGYIVWETNNISYSILLHFFNNFVSVVVLYGLQAIIKLAGFPSDLNMPAGKVQLPLIVVGFYLFLATAVPICMYVGSFLLHKGIPGARETLFPKEKKITLCVLIGSTMCIFLLSVVICAKGI
ncbi:MAG: type II CAAX endopeptidase family protein [Lachnospiraceae bacterium]